MTAASPSMAADICGTIPNVQPNAAAMLGFEPRVSATARVYSTPVPGETITISEVSRKEIDMAFAFIPAPVAAEERQTHGHVRLPRPGRRIRVPHRFSAGGS